MTAKDISPFSFPVKVQSLPSKGRFVTFEADDGVAHKIAEENQLIAVESFVATAHVTPWKRDGISVSGKVAAKIVQPCAISGEPLSTVVEARSYSRISGLASWEVATESPGMPARTSAAARSWTGLR